MRKKGAAKVRTVLYLQREAHEQLMLLAATFNVSPPSVVAQALARWLLEEPLLKKGTPSRPRKLKLVEPGSDGAGA